MKEEVRNMLRPKFRFTHDEVRIIVMALVEFKNQLLAEGRYTDAIDDLLIKPGVKPMTSTLKHITTGCASSGSVHSIACLPVRTATWRQLRLRRR